MRKIASVILTGILVTVFCSLALAEEKKESGMGNMCGMMMGKSLVATSDGGVIVLMGNRLQKYDKDLVLQKEVEIKLDMEGMQKMMMQMVGKCPMMQQQGGMMGGMQDPQVKLKCAEEWLKKAIELHELHMRDPRSTTEASQMELMDQIKKAHECVTGTALPLGSGTKELEKQTETKTSSQREVHH